jgi:hypothetical protein
VKYNDRPSGEIQGVPSLTDVFTGGPRFTGSPKVKSAFETSVAIQNATINTSKIVFFNYFPFIIYVFY